MKTVVLIATTFLIANVSSLVQAATTQASPAKTAASKASTSTGWVNGAWDLVHADKATQKNGHIKVSGCDASTCQVELSTVDSKNYHDCQASGSIDAASPEAKFSDEGTPNCVIEMKRVDTSLTISSGGGGCTQICGAGASVDGKFQMRGSAKK